jgi:hypothetical protein
VPDPTAGGSSCELCRESGGEVLGRDGFCRVVLVGDPDYPAFCRVILPAPVWGAPQREGAQQERVEPARLAAALVSRL